MIPLKKQDFFEEQVISFNGEGYNQGYNQEETVITNIKLLKSNNLSENEVWLTVKEGYNLLNISQPAILKNIKAGKYTTKLVDGNGGKQYRILLSSLPEFAQFKYFRTTTAMLPTETGNLYQGNNLPSPASFGGVPLVPILGTNQIAEFLTEEQKTVALARFDLITHWKQFRQSSKQSLDVLDGQFEHAYNNLKQYPDLFEILGGASVKTLYRWIGTLKSSNNDPYSLAPNYKYGKTGPKITALEAEKILKFLLNPNGLKFQEVIRAAIRELKIEGMLNFRSDATYRRWIEEWALKNSDVFTFCREGYKALNDKVLLYIMRNRNLIEVGDILVIDGHKSGYRTLHPVTKREMRMTKIVIYDFKTDMPVGLEIMPSENAYALGSALRRAILFMGFKPKAIYIDNGRPEKSKWFLGDLNQSGIRGLIQRLGIPHVFIAQAYHGQSKTIERFFGTSQEMERQAITYSGTSIASKPAYLMRNEKFHVRIHEQLMKKAGMVRDTGIGITIEEDYLMNVLWFEDYITRQHVGGFYKGRSPLEVYRESFDKVKQQEDFESRLLSKEHLDYLMMPETIKTLYRNGIKIGDKYYWHSAFYTMEKGGDKVNFTIKYDMADDSSILVYDDAGNFIGEAFLRDEVDPAAKLHLVEENTQQLQEQLAEKSALVKKTMTDTKNIINHIYDLNPPDFDKTKKLIAQKEEKKQQRAKGKGQRESTKSIQPDFEIEERTVSNSESVDLDI